jgi:dihydroorotase
VTATIILRGVRILGGPPADLRIDGDRITAVGGGIDAGASPGARVISADGLIVLPAFVDLHTHLREPGGEDSETIATGTRAAAAGGYSDVFAMANCDPVTDTPDRVRNVFRAAARDSACRIHAAGAVTTGLAGRELAPIGAMARAGARMFSDDGHCVDDPAIMRAALRESARAGTFIAQHAQSGSLAAGGQVNEGPAAGRTGLSPWPAAAEETIVARDVILTGHTPGSRLHVCHVSTAGTVDLVRWAKRQGRAVTAEVTPHHLLLTDDRASGRDPLYKVNPPLRTAEDVDALRTALRDGTIDAVATDHAPHNAARKDQDWCHAAFGMTGLETALAVVADVLTDQDGEPDWALVSEVMSRRPARIGGIADEAGRALAPGEPATFTVIDPEAQWRVDPAAGQSMSRNSPFTGRCFRHRVTATMIAGHVTSDLSNLFKA